MSVALINLFLVPKGKEDEFVRLWEAIKVDINQATWIHQWKVPHEPQTG